MAHKKDLQVLLADLDDAGFSVTLKRSGHYQIRAPRRPEDGSGLTYCPSSPSDRRGLRNLKAWARRHGFAG